MATLTTLLLALCAAPFVQEQSQEQAENQLYSDDFVRGMARRDVDRDIAVGEEKGILAQPVLDVVAPGKSLPIADILTALNLDQERLERLSEQQLHNVVFLTLRMSPSYSLSIMCDARAHGAVTDKTDLTAIQGYGVRVIAAK